MFSFCLLNNQKGNYMIIPPPSYRTNKNHNCPEDCGVLAVLFNPGFHPGFLFSRRRHDDAPIFVPHETFPACPPKLLRRWEYNRRKDSYRHLVREAKPALSFVEVPKDSFCHVERSRDIWIICVVNLTNHH